jgi:small subunit ribosomal protein S8e
MTKWQLRSKRKPTGKLRKKLSKRKKYQRGRDYSPTHLGEKKVVKLRTKGGSKKLLALSANIANVISGSKSQKTKIISVMENPANPQFVRRSIITKGTIINTELGKARVTSRPGRDGIVNAVIIEAK